MGERCPADVKAIELQSAPKEKSIAYLKNGISNNSMSDIDMESSDIFYLNTIVQFKRMKLSNERGTKTERERKRNKKTNVIKNDE